MEKKELLMVAFTGLMLFSFTYSVTATLADDMVISSKVFLCVGWNALFQLIGPLAVLMLVVAGIIWVKSESEARDRMLSKQIITNVFIGLIIMLVGGAVVYLVTYSATGGSDAFDIIAFCP